MNGARGSIELTDPRQMRALAHPLRLRLLGMLRADGPATATMLGGEVGESAALVSYHLRTLARHGFIDQADDLARDRRERRWRASHRGMTWEPARFLDTPDRAAAAGALLEQIAGRYAEALRQWVVESSELPDEWIEASDMSDWRLELTPEQVLRMREELVAVIERYEALPPEEGAEPIRTLIQLLPQRRRYGR
jgi:DNA-binding transcriptional ArsR family regulator